MKSCCAFADYYEVRGMMPPIHDCPAQAPPDEFGFVWTEPTPLDDYLDLMLGNPLGRKLDVPGRWT